MNVHYLQHVPFEGLGSIASWMRMGGHHLSVTRFFQNDLLPGVDKIDWLIVMGGPMGACDDDKFPWLSSEKRFIKEAIREGKTVIGICLGAQLIASVLGARVYPNRFKEIGWFPIKMMDAGKNSSLFDFFPENLEVFHWHGDTFDLPAGAVHIARSEACQNQAFVYAEKVIGLQFHLECTNAGVAQLLENCSEELIEGSYIQTPSRILPCDKDFDSLNGVMGKLLDNLRRIPEKMD